MKKRYAFIGTASFVGLLFAAGTFAQGYGGYGGATSSGMTTAPADTAGIASQVSSLRAAVATLAEIDASRRTITGSVSDSLASIAAEVGSVSAMSMATDADRQAVSQKIAETTAKVGGLAPLVTGVASVRSGEADLLETVSAHLRALQGQLG